ncbi:MAG: hypothetical protein EZS28_023255 [Streblomastix strix]|uniref:Uncharacterized protein n=1 Tax=Streblomastix strix TaxID=222440 RepID=A0A5J4VFP4_9EUKA|nr:MAG: hypothetical protein EZS28_023255 [Streblomastix strix]
MTNEELLKEDEPVQQYYDLLRNVNKMQVARQDLLEFKYKGIIIIALIIRYSTLRLAEVHSCQDWGLYSLLSPHKYKYR